MFTFLGTLSCFKRSDFLALLTVIFSEFLVRHFPSPTNDYRSKHVIDGDSSLLNTRHN